MRALEFVRCPSRETVRESAASGCSDTRSTGTRSPTTLLRAYEGVAPDFTRYLVEFAFGEIYARPGELKHRELVAIASLATMGGCDPQLETHVHGAFNAGLGEAEIVEAVMTLIPYIGFPRALQRDGRGQARCRKTSRLRLVCQAGCFWPIAKRASRTPGFGGSSIVACIFRGRVARLVFP